jgi:phage shock protein C
MNCYRDRKTCFKDMKNKKIAGVCAGVAERFNMPIWLTRLLTVLLFLKFPMFTLLAYGVGYAVLPSKV